MTLKHLSFNKSLSTPVTTSLHFISSGTIITINMTVKLSRCLIINDNNDNNKNFNVNNIEQQYQ